MDKVKALRAMYDASDKEAIAGSTLFGIPWYEFENGDFEFIALYAMTMWRREIAQFNCDADKLFPKWSKNDE